MVFKALNGLSPPYITELIHHHSAPRSLRSGSLGLLHVPRTRQKQRGDRAFAVAAPRLWNELPPAVRNAPSSTIFKSRLKTHLFSLAFPPLLWYLVYFICFLSMSMYVVCVPLYASLHHVRHFGQWKLFLNVPYIYILLTYFTYLS